MFESFSQRICVEGLLAKRTVDACLAPLLDATRVEVVSLVARQRSYQVSVCERLHADGALFVSSVLRPVKQSRKAPKVHPDLFSFVRQQWLSQVLLILHLPVLVVLLLETVIVQ